MLYRIQQWMSITQYELRVLLVLFVLICSGLVVKEFRQRPQPLPPDIYEEDMRLLEEGSAAMRAAAGLDSDLSYETEQDTGAARPRITARSRITAPLRINVNTASATELDILPQVGPATAAAIIEYRRRRGEFETVDELLLVSGIGPKTLAEIRPHAYVE